MDKKFSIALQLEYSARFIGGSSFAIGTLLSAVAPIDKTNDKIYMFGGIFSIVALMVNSVMLLLLILSANLFKTKRRRLQNTPQSYDLIFLYLFYNNYKP